MAFGPSYTLAPTQLLASGCFTSKRKGNGSIDHYKGLLVTKGFNQQHGVDFCITYSLVVNPMAIHRVLSIAMLLGWPIHRIDVHNVFLHGWLFEDVCMAQLHNFIYPQFPHHVCKLYKALYGLKQSPCAWYLNLAIVYRACVVTHIVGSCEVTQIIN